MESNQQEDSKSSSEETDRSEHDTGTGRSYECVFCKRGFTTAQALGGHMNIHRKDRAKPRPSSVPSISSKHEEDNYTSFRGYPPVQNYPSHPHSTSHHHHEVHMNYQTFFPAPMLDSGTIRPPPHAQDTDDLNRHGEDRRWGLGLQSGPSHADDDEERREDSTEADELDLELRLGHDP